MILFKKGKSLNRYILEYKMKGISVGWVPTMGALHQGHLSLIDRAQKDNPLVICSLFVNPTQFNDKNDFRKYPKTIEKDIYMLEEKGVDLLFLPDEGEIYPAGTNALEHYDLGSLEMTLEGASRPGHFQGVCQVMNRLMNIIAPDHLYMGQKDYQQCLVIRKLLELLEAPVMLHTCPTRREPDGLAMSSRNMRLNETERKHAIGIYEALSVMKKNLRKGSLSGIIDQAKAIISRNDFRTDYVVITHAQTLEPCESWDGIQPLVALIAAYQHEVRLIDSLVLTETLD
jgi:pantoate--beta-alanine ligase